jgi:hypothetical protein
MKKLEEYAINDTTYAVVQVYTKRRVGNVSDVFIKYCNDDPILLGQIEVEHYNGDTQWWTTPDHGGSEDVIYHGRKRDGVYRLCKDEGLKYFDAAHFEYGRITWRMKRIEGSHAWR